MIMNSDLYLLIGPTIGFTILGIIFKVYLHFGRWPEEIEAERKKLSKTH
ncbi:MAG: hypothetical protein Greene041619_967 [Candidatus Peregrinibacteria bacterium Greene0416_19]|nr:MAG: hypothetical protein Greene041619_967 [Candidatus Peregrinibacteria bacterium Greene0416_19]